MKVLPLHPGVQRYLEARKLRRKFEKQKALFEQNPFHRSLYTELLEPRAMRVWSFRVDRKYRALFIFRDATEVEVIDVNNHYQ